MTPPVPRMSTRKRALPSASQSASVPARQPTKVASVRKADADLRGLVRRYREVHLEDRRPGTDVTRQQWEVWRDMATSEEVSAGR